jgi:hypothetical protein
LEARHCSAAARGDISEGRCWRRCSSERRRVHVRSGRAASWQQGDDVVDVILGIDDWVAAQVPLVGSGRAATAVQRRGAASPEGGDAGGDARVSGVRCTPPRKGDILGGESSEEGCQERHPGSGASSERVCMVWACVGAPRPAHVCMVWACVGAPRPAHVGMVWACVGAPRPAHVCMVWACMGAPRPAHVCMVWA